MERLLIVEGSDDERVVHRLCERMGVDRNFCIDDKQGLDRLLRSISTELKVAGRLALGIMVDANDNPASRWQAIAGRIGAAGIIVPECLDPGGTTIESTPRVGIWLMPDNQSGGEIEDFLARLIPANDPQWLRAKYINDIPSDERKFSLNRATRAELYAWLATRKAPRLMGQAVQAGDLDTDHPIAEAFAAWLTRTFGP